MAKIDKKEKRIINLFIQACGILTVFLGLSAILGWIFDIPQLASFDSSIIPMAFSTAVLFVAYGLIIFFHNRLPSNRIMSRVEVVISLTGILVALLFLYLSLKGIRPVAEHLGLKMSSAVDGLVVGHMSPITAFCFLLVGLSFMIILLKPGQKKLIKLSLIFAVLIFLISIVFLLSYLFGAPLLYEGSFIPPAITTSLALLFLGISLLLISGLKVWSNEELSDVLSTRYTYILALVFIVLIVSVMTTGYSYYKNYEKHFRSEIENQLSSIASLKVSQIVQWRKERLGDAEIFYKNKAFANLVMRYFQNDLDSKTRIQSWIYNLQQSLETDQVTLIDMHFNKKIIFPENEELEASFINKNTELKLRSGEIVFQDFYYNEKHKKIYLKVFVPILDEQTGTNLIGILTLRIDPQQYLYPLINKWPTPSKTAETLIVRREGDEVVFLNDLKFQKNTALNLRRPLTELNLPAVRAALGKNEFMEGTDYRGVSVIAYVCPIPNSPWFLVARIDTSEVYTPLREIFWAIIILMAIFLAGLGVSVGFIWRNQRSKFHKERYQSTENIRKLNRVYAVLSNINEAIVRIRNPQELFEKACDIAIEKGGFQMAWIGKINSQTKKVDLAASNGVSEVHLKKIDLNCEGDENLLGIAGRVFKTGAHVISNDIQNDESILPLHKESIMYGSMAFAAFPLKVFGQVWGIFNLYSSEIGFFDEEELKLLDELARDISFAIEFDDKEAERKRAEEDLRESEIKFRTVIEEATEIIFTTNTEGYFTYANPITLKSSGYSLDELKQLKYIDLIEPEWKKRVKQIYFKQYLEKSGLSNTEYPFRTKSGEIKWFNQNTRLIIENDEVKGFYVIARDVTERRKVEESLSESEERFRSLYENSTIGLYRTTPDGKIILANPTLIKMLGYLSFEELVARNLEKDGFSPSYERKYFIEQIEKNGEVIGLESMWISKDGTAVYISESARALKDSNGKTLYYDGTVENISERKRTESTLMKLSSAVEQALDTIIITDREGTIEYVNPAFEDLTGYSSEEALGKTPRILKSGAKDQKYYEELWKTILSGKVFRAEVVNKKKNGDLYSEEKNITPIFDKNKNITHFVGTGIDITERKKMEADLSAAAEIAKLGYWEYDVDSGNFIFDDQYFRLIHGSSTEKQGGNIMSGEEFARKLVYPEDSHMVAKALQSAIQSPDPDYFSESEARVFRDDGTVTNVSVQFKIQKDHLGRTYKIYGVNQDITERKRTEKELIEAKERAEQSDKLKTEFLAQMSHEIRTPLNAIVGNVEYLNGSFGKKMDSDTRDCFDGIDLASRRIIRTVDLILNAAELQTSGYKPHLVKIDLIEILDNLYQEHLLSAKQKGLELIYVCEVNEIYILADEYSITQIFANLIDNAIKYTKKGKVEILLGKNKTGNITVEIKDTGIGISEEFRTRIFEPFAQEEQGYNRSFEGNGLGLALVKRYCELNNAMIEVESEKNVGSTFRIIFNKKITEV